MGSSTWRKPWLPLCLHTQWILVINPKTNTFTSFLITHLTRDITWFSAINRAAHVNRIKCVLTNTIHTQISRRHKHSRINLKERKQERERITAHGFLFYSVLPSSPRSFVCVHYSRPRPLRLQNPINEDHTECGSQLSPWEALIV